MKTSTLLGAILLLSTAMVIDSAAYAKVKMTGRGSGPVIYVTSQGLFYDSIVLTDLPQHGDFQKLEAAGPSGLQTEFGPGDGALGYRGGRWWMDANGDGVMDGDDAYFMCPLLGPGRDTP